MAAIADEEKTNDLKRLVLAVGAADEVELITAVQGTSADSFVGR